MDKNQFVMDYLKSHVNQLYQKALSEHRILQKEQPGIVEVKQRSQSVTSLKNHMSKYDDNLAGMESLNEVFGTNGKNDYRSDKLQSDYRVRSQSEQTIRLEKLVLQESPVQPHLGKFSDKCKDVNKSLVGESMNTCNITGVNKEMTCVSQNNFCTDAIKITESDKNGIWSSRNIASRSHGQSNITSTIMKISHKSHRSSLCAPKIKEKTFAKDNKIFSGTRDIIRRNDDIKQKTKISSLQTVDSKVLMRGNAPIRNSGKVLVDPEESSDNLSGDRTLLSLGRSSSSISLSDEESYILKSGADTETDMNVSDCNWKTHKIKISKKVSPRRTDSIRSRLGSSSTEVHEWCGFDIKCSSSGDDSKDKHLLGQWGNERIEGCSHVNKILPVENFSLRLPPKHSSVILPADYLPSTESETDLTMTSTVNNRNFPLTVDHSSLASMKQDLISPKRDLISPKRDLISPKRDFISPKRDLISPKRDMISPDGEVTLTSPEGEDLILPTCDVTMKRSAVGLSMPSPVRDLVVNPPDKVMSPGDSRRIEHRETIETRTSEVLPLTTANINKHLGQFAKETKDTDSDNNSNKSCVIRKAGIRRPKQGIEDKGTENKVKMGRLEKGNKDLANGLSDNSGKRKRPISSGNIENHTKRSRYRSTDRFEEQLGDCTDLKQKHKRKSCKQRSESCSSSTNGCYKGKNNQRSVIGDNIKKNVRTVIVNNKMKSNPLVIKGGKTRSACRKYLEKKQKVTESISQKHCKQRRILQNHKDNSCANPTSIKKLNYLERKTLVSDSESVIGDVHCVMPLVDVTQWSNGMKTYKMSSATSSSSTDSDSKHHPGGIWKSIFQEN